MASQVTQQKSQERRDVDRLDVVRLKVQVDSHALPYGRYRERDDRRKTIMLIRVAHDGGAALRSPCTAARGDKHEAAFIEENEMGTKSLSVFLSAAICTSNAQSRLHRAGPHDVPEPGTTNPQNAKLA